MRKLAAAFVAGALMVGAPVVALAHHGGQHRAIYRQIDGPSWFPARVVIRCEGWAEDTTRLRLVSFEPERVVYRCVLP
jgi:hypothetical protein